MSARQNKAAGAWNAHQKEVDRHFTGFFEGVGSDVGQVDKGLQSSALAARETHKNVGIAKAYLAQLGKSGLWGSKPIATKIEPYKAFYAAEAYHQDFMLANPTHGYIRRWDAPKVAALKRMYPGVYRPTFLKDAK